jgi:CPA2 family monovalent cation:H+ antiporter-2
VIAKVLAELRRLESPETSVVLSILVLEDLAMAVYLLSWPSSWSLEEFCGVAVSVSVVVVTVFLILMIAIRYGSRLRAWFAHESDEMILLTAFGAVLFVAGISQRLQFIRGRWSISCWHRDIRPNGWTVSQTSFAPRDLSAATFFFFFGLEIDPSILPPALLTALLLAGVTTLTKILSGYWAAGRIRVDRQARLRAGMALVARGVFSVVIAGLGAAREPRLGPLSAA